MLSLKDLRLCKTCTAEIPLTAKFCPKCGAVQEEVKPVVENNTANTTPVATEAPAVESTPVQQPADNSEV